VLFDAFGRPHPGSVPGLKKINDFNGRKEKCNFLWILCRSSIYLDLWAQDDKLRHMCCRETALWHLCAKSLLCALIGTLKHS
jgi:hypothetical protein